MIRESPYNAEAPDGALKCDITPTEQHYVRSNFELPAHNGTLGVDGAVGQSLKVTAVEIQAMPAVEHTVTLECAGNGRLRQTPLPTGEPWGLNAVSTGRWTGALLRDLLDQAQPAQDAIEVWFHGADRGRHHKHDDMSFVRALPLDVALDPDVGVLLAYALNGEPLSVDHGAPVRLI